MQDADDEATGHMAMTGGEPRWRTKMEIRFDDGAMESSTSAIAVADLEGRLKRVNSPFLRMWGYESSEEVVGRHAAEFWSMERQAAAVVTGLTQDAGWRGELVATRKDGSTFNVHLSANLVADEDGQAMYMEVSSGGLTEPQGSEEAFQESEKRFRALIENSSDAVVILDGSAKVRYESPSLLRIFGPEDGEAVGQSLFERIHPDDMLRVGEAFDQLLGNPGARLRTELCVQHSDGSWRSVEATGSNLLHDPSVEGVVINMRDITERKAAEERIAFLSEIVENSPVAIIATDSNRHIIYANRAMEQLYGYRKEELLGGDPAMLGADPEADRIEKELWSSVSQGGVWRGEIVNRKKNGDVFHVQASAYRLVDKQGNFLALVGFQHDITDRKRAEGALRESESRYRLLAENVTDVIYFIDMNTRPLYISPSIENLLGYTLEESMARTMEESLTPASVEVAARSLAKAAELQEAGQVDHYGERTLELEMRRKDGSTVWTENTMSFVLDPDGRPVGILGVSRDITERKRAGEELRRQREHLEEEVEKRTADLVTTNEQLMQEIADRERAEEELARSEARYRLLAEDVSDVIWSMTPDLRYTYVSRSVARLRGYTVEEVMSQAAEEVLTPASLELANRARAEEMAREKTEGEDRYTSRTLEMEMTCKDGSTVLTETVVTYLYGPDGNMVAILGVSRDITERKRAEERVRRLNVVLRATRSVNQLITKEKDRDRLLQGACDHLVGTRGYQSAWIALVDRNGGLTKATEAGLGESFLPVVERLRSGHLIACAQRALAQSDVMVTENPSLSCGDCPLAEGHARKTAMTVRLEQEVKVYGVLSVSIPAEIPADDEERSLFEELAADISFALRSIEMEEQRKQAEGEIRQANDQLREALQQVEASQAQVLQSAKLAAIGELISGVTHELNNPLAAVSMYAELLLEEVEDEGTRRYVQKLKGQTDRANTIVKNLLSFARRHEPRKSYISINECLTRTVELRAYELNLDNIQVILRLDDNLPKTMADFNQLQQVFLNIVTNAHQVMMEAHGRGMLVIQTKRLGDMMRIRFADDGPGIPADKLDRIFEPFFTTKDVGKGTGLGLSICYGIVQEHGGRIWAESEEGKGALFVVELPIIIGEDGYAEANRGVGR